MYRNLAASSEGDALSALEALNCNTFTFAALAIVHIGLYTMIKNDIVFDALRRLKEREDEFSKINNREDDGNELTML